MKQANFLRYTVLSIGVLYSLSHTFSYGTYYKEFSKNAFQFFGDSSKVSFYWDIHFLQFIVHDLLLILVGIGSFWFVHKTINKCRVQLKYLVLIALSIPLGYVLSTMDELINPFHFLVHKGPIRTDVLSLFGHLVLKNSIEVLSVILLALTVYIIEEAYITNLRKRKLLFSLPTGSYFIVFIPILFIFSFILFYGGGFDIIYLSNLFFQIIILDLILGFLGLTFAIYLQEDGKNILQAISEIIIIYFGICLSILTFSIFRSLGLGDLFLSTITEPELVLMSFFALIPMFTGLLSYLLFKKTIRLKANSLVIKSELSLLKSQINPHFLFNSLNSIYGTAMQEQSPKTAEGVQKLSEMMRFMLKENTASKISIEKELSYIHNYIDLQRLRIDEKDNIQVNVEIYEACKGEITPMLLIPFIENAFKHGISLNSPSWINIKLACTSNRISLEVNNSIHKKQFSKKEESGIGLQNVIERLKLLYPEKHELHINSDKNTYFVSLNLTLT